MFQFNMHQVDFKKYIYNLFYYLKKYITEIEYKSKHYKDFLHQSYLKIT